MKKAVVLPIVAAVSGALIGCGGSSGGGGYTPKNVTWSFVEPLRVTQEELNTDFKGCSIYFNHTSVDDQDFDYFVIGRQATRQFQVLMHDVDGSIIEEFQPSTTGTVTFDWKTIPEGGYMSVEENEGRNSGSRESFITSFQKEFVQNMTLSIRYSQDGNDCVRNESFRYAESDLDARVALAGGAASYYQTSASMNQVTGAGADNYQAVPVHSDVPATEKKLATAFRDADGMSYNNFMSYAVFDRSNIYSQETGIGSEPVVLMDALSHEEFTISVASGVAFNRGSVNVVLDNNVYSWQEVFEQADGLTKSGIVFSDTQLSHWNVLLEGISSDNTGKWTLTTASALDSTTDVHFLENYELSSFEQSVATASCVGGASNCVSLAGYAPQGWDVQRTHVRTKTVNGRDAFQTIYHTPATEQILLESVTEYLSVASNDTVIVGLLDAGDMSDEEAALYIAASSYNVDVLSDHSIEPSTHKYDVNGLILGQSGANELSKTVMKTNSELVANSVNW